MIEGELSLDMAKTMILPVAIKQQQLIADNIIKLKSVEVKAGIKELKENLTTVGNLIAELCTSATALKTAISKKSTEEILSSMEKLRTAVDRLEKEVDDTLWPLPKYGEMLFIY